MDPLGKVVLDCRQLLCPLPVIRVQDRVANLPAGTRVEALCTDRGALEDIPAWCRVHGHRVLAIEGADGEYRVSLLVGGDRANRPPAG